MEGGLFNNSFSLDISHRFCVLDEKSHAIGGEWSDELDDFEPIPCPSMERGGELIENPV